MRRSVRHAALLSALSALPAFAAEPLPRIFYSAPQRAAITATRGATPAGSDTIAISVASAAPAAAAAGEVLPRTQRLEGIVMARTGERFAWIGGRRYADGERFGEWRLRISAHGVALLRDGGVARQLRVGEAVVAVTAAGTRP